MRLTKLLNAVRYAPTVKVPSTAKQQVEGLGAIHKFGVPGAWKSRKQLYQHQIGYIIATVVGVAAISYMRHLENLRMIEAVQYDVKLYPKPSGDDYRWWDMQLFY